jgi:hypothetical protein
MRQCAAHPRRPTPEPVGRKDRSDVLWSRLGLSGGAWPAGYELLWTMTSRGMGHGFDEREHIGGALFPGRPTTTPSTEGRHMDANPVNIYEYEALAKGKLGQGEYASSREGQPTRSPSVAPGPCSMLSCYGRA